MRRQSGQSIEACVHEGCLAAARGAHHENILFRAHSGADDLAMFQTAHGVEKIILAPEMVQRVVFAGEDAGSLVFGQREDATRPQTDCEYRPTDDGRDDPLESTAVYRQ